MLTLCCELLSKNCIFDILNNNSPSLSLHHLVVNCFQKIVSLIFWTTSSRNALRWLTLWIAFKKLYLWYSEQQSVEREANHESCELLSKNCIFDILNNCQRDYIFVFIVVNCFQKIVSLIFWTTRRNTRCTPTRLWIAFKKLYLWYSEQQWRAILWILLRLWIAFKKLYLWYSEQQELNSVLMKNGCELLSKNCIFDILNNFKGTFRFGFWVVNCFQKIVSLIFWTTAAAQETVTYWLWIAFKKLYLWYSEQLKTSYPSGEGRCELLSKNCIFDILNNKRLKGMNMRPVVNCFQKIVSLIFWTTEAFIAALLFWLWIAFKKLYLWYSEQQDINILLKHSKL